MTQLSCSLAYGPRTGHPTPQITCSSMFMAALVTIARKWEDPDEQTIRMFSRYTVKYYSPVKKIKS